MGKVSPITDHGGLQGLGDDDHTQYVLHTEVDDSPVDGVTTDPISSNWAFDHVAAADPHTGYRLESTDHTHQSTGAQAGTLDHGLALTGLTDDDHTQYALLLGRSGGQTLIGGTGSGDDLTLQSTSHATRGTIFLGASSAYDEVNTRLGIGTTTPTVDIQVVKTGEATIEGISYGTSGTVFRSKLAGGTPGSETAILSGQVIYQLNAQGYNGSAFTGSKGAVQIYAAENWSTTANGTYISFQTTAKTTPTSPLR